MTIQLSKPADLLGLVGLEIGTGEWHAITQHQVNIFADATHDHEWIHVEPERAAKGPYRGPDRARLPDIVVLSGVSRQRSKDRRGDGRRQLRRQQGSLPAPMPVGSRIREHVRLVSAEQKQAGLECALGILAELEGSDRPACVIETVVIYQ